MWKMVIIRGKPLHAFNAEELTARNEQPNAADKMCEHLDKHCNKVFQAARWMNESSIFNEMQDYIFDVEMQSIKKMRTGDFARRIIFQKGDVKDNSLAMAQLAHLVLQDAAVEDPSQWGCLVFDGHKPFYVPNNELFLNNGPGNFFITFDKGILLRMSGSKDSDYLVQDQPNAIAAVYCI